MRVAIVEDEGITALYLEEVISDYGHEVIGVFDRGESLFLCLESNAVDLVFMDIQINGALDGIQVADIVHHKYPEISFVFLTSFKDSTTIESAKVVRPIGYLAKPVIDSDIEAILMVASSREEKQKESVVDKIHIGAYTYSAKEGVLEHNDTYVTLSKNEHLFVRELFLHRGSHVSIEQLIHSIWADDTDRLSSLRELASRLRNKLPDIEINNIPNVGYVVRERV